MTHRIIESRFFLSFVLSALTGLALFLRTPFSVEDPILGLIGIYRPHIFLGFQFAYTAMLFTTPFIVFSMRFSLLYIFVAGQKQKIQTAPLPV